MDDSAAPDRPTFGALSFALGFATRVFRENVIDSHETTQSLAWIQDNLRPLLDAIDRQATDRSVIAEPDGFDLDVAMGDLEFASCQRAHGAPDALDALYAARQRIADAFDTLESELREARADSEQKKLDERYEAYFAGFSDAVTQWGPGVRPDENAALSRIAARKYAGGATPQEEAK